jgi:hypothetical protein
MLQFSMGKLLVGVSVFGVFCAVLIAFPAYLSLFVIYSLILLLMPVFVVLAVFGRDALRAFAIGSATAWLIALGGIDAGPRVWEHLKWSLQGNSSPDQMVFQAKIIYLVMIAWIILGGLMSLAAYLFAFKDGIRPARHRAAKDRESES